MISTISDNTSLILAAEDCPPEEFEQLHYFSRQEHRVISNLIAHGPVLLKGARGSGKSALMIEASRKMYPEDISSSAFGIQPVFVKRVIFSDQDSFLERLSAFGNNTLDTPKLYSTS